MQLKKGISMNSANKPLSKRGATGLGLIFTVILAVFVVTAAICLLCSCSTTVTPKAFDDQTPSYDAGQLNSGLIGFYTNEAGVVSMVVTPNFRDRYNAVIPTLGTNFHPALKADAGIYPFTNGTSLLDLEHLVKFTTMNRWRKQSLKPP